MSEQVDSSSLHDVVLDGIRGSALGLPLGFALGWAGSKIGWDGESIARTVAGNADGGFIVAGAILRGNQSPESRATRYGYLGGIAGAISLKLIGAPENLTSIAMAHGDATSGVLIGSAEAVRQKRWRGLRNFWSIPETQGIAGAICISYLILKGIDPESIIGNNGVLAGATESTLMNVGENFLPFGYALLCDRAKNNRQR